MAAAASEPNRCSAPCASAQRSHAPSTAPTPTATKPAMLKCGAINGAATASRSPARSGVRSRPGAGGGNAVPAHQRAAASSSASRASTQRSPCGVDSFFQNGARVFR